MLSEALKVAGIPHWYCLATDKSMLLEALGNHLIAAWTTHQRLPILHLSMHGTNDGVALTSGEFLSWHELREHLLPLLRKMQGGLLICMSSCFGSAGCRMAMYTDGEPPFWALVGNNASATWADAAVAYVSFYHLLFKDFPVPICVESMKAASGDHQFNCWFGNETQKDWQLFLQQNANQLQPPKPKNENPNSE